MKEIIETMVDGGKATGGPPLGPALGPVGVPINKVVEAINEKTAAFEGMKVPVKVIVETDDKSFEIEIGTPPTSSLIMKELGIEKGSGEPKTDFVGDLTLEQAKKIAEMKKDSMLGASLKARVLEVLGVCVSMGVRCDGKPAKEMQAEIARGDHDNELQ
jgi:large subunit ribosomal protein L11